MNIEFHFKQVSDAAKDSIRDYANEKLEHLERFVSSFQDDDKRLHIDVEYREKHNEFEVKTALHLGGKVIHHVEVTHDPNEAIDKSEANLIRQAKKHVEQLRSAGDIEPDDEVPEVTYDNI